MKKLGFWRSRVGLANWRLENAAREYDRRVGTLEDALSWRNLHMESMVLVTRF